MLFLSTSPVAEKTRHFGSFNVLYLRLGASSPIQGWISMVLRDSAGPACASWLLGKNFNGKYLSK